MNRKKYSITLISPVRDAIVSQQTPVQREFTQMLEIPEADQQNDWLNLRKTEKADQSIPAFIKCAWRYGGPVFSKVYAEVAEDPAFTSGVMKFAAAKGRKSVFLHSLKINTTYWLRVHGISKKGTETVSAVRCFSTMDESPRWIFVEGVSNVRDMGGWKTKHGMRVKQGLFYRGGEFNVHMTATPEAKRFLREEIGLKSVLDIRGFNAQGELVPQIPGMPSDTKWINIPLGAYASSFKPQQKEAYAKSFRAALNPENLPMYFHCWGGADRTGTFAFLFNAVLGVDDESLLKDYELTSLAIWGSRSRTTELWKGFEQKMEELVPGGDYEAKALAYFKSAGITDSEIAALKKLYLEPVC